MPYDFCKNLYRNFVLAFVLVSMFSLAHARENTRAFFQYATPIELPSVNKLTLAELVFTPSMYDTLRSDRADLRVVQNSNNGAIPVKIRRMKKSQDSEDLLVSREFVILSEIPSDLRKRYAENSIFLFAAARFPLSRINMRLNQLGFHTQYLLIGQRSTHAVGSDWILLKRGTLSHSETGGYNTQISFSETSCLQYALVLDKGVTEKLCGIESVAGPQYSACFQITPGESYTLLSGYPDAASVSGDSSAAIDRMLEKGGEPVRAELGELAENPDWNQRGFASMFKGKMAILPVAVAIGLILALLIFALIYSFFNRSRPIKINKRPRFHVE